MNTRVECLAVKCNDTGDAQGEHRWNALCMLWTFATCWDALRHVISHLWVLSQPV